MQHNELGPLDPEVSVLTIKVIPPTQSKPWDVLILRFWKFDKVIVMYSSHSFDSNLRITPTPDYQAVP